MKRSRESVCIDIPLLCIDCLFGVWSASIISTCIFHDQISRSEHYRIMYRIWVRKLQVNCFIYKSWFLFRHISEKRPFFGVWSVLSYRIEFWSLNDFKHGECLLKLCGFPLTHELHWAFEPFKGIIFWSHSHLRTYRFSVHYISLRKLPSWLWKMVLPLVLKPERQHLTEWSTLCRTPG